MHSPKTSPERAEGDRQMPSLKDSEEPDRKRQEHAEDHQGDADGRRGQAAPRPGGRRSRPALCRADERRDVGAWPPRSATGDGAPKLLAGNGRRPGASAGRDDRRARPVRRLQLDHRQAGRASAANELAAPGKTVKILTVGKKGREQLKRDWAQALRRPCRPERGQAGRLCQRAGRSRARSLARVRGGRVRRGDASSTTASSR